MYRIRLTVAFFGLLVFGVGLLPAKANSQNSSIDVPDIKETQPKADTPSAAVAMNRILAVVDSKMLTMDDYRSRYGDTVITYGRLSSMVNGLLLQAAAEERNMSLSSNRLDQLVTRQIDRIQRQPGGLGRLLRRQGLTEAQFRNQMRKRIRKQILESRLMAEIFPQVRSQDTHPAYVSVRARLILVDDLAEAWRLYRWLQKQPTESTWNRLYRKHSKKLGLMGENGDLGWFGWGQFNRKIEYRVFKLPLYAVSEPFQLRNGYALVYPTGYRMEPTVSEPGKAFKVYQRYRRRFLREKLYERLREEQSVNIPKSVKERLYE